MKAREEIPTGNTCPTCNGSGRIGGSEGCTLCQQTGVVYVKPPNSLHRRLRRRVASGLRRVAGGVSQLAKLVYDDDVPFYTSAHN